jgi:hypothetical protein
MLGTCRLCQQTKELQESHIIQPSHLGGSEAPTRDTFDTHRSPIGVFRMA